MDKQMSLNTKQRIEQLKPTKNSFEFRCFGGEGMSYLIVIPVLLLILKYNNRDKTCTRKV